MEPVGLIRQHRERHFGNRAQFQGVGPDESNVENNMRAVESDLHVQAQQSQMGISDQRKGYNTIWPSIKLVEPVGDEVFDVISFDSAQEISDKKNFSDYLVPLAKLEFDNGIAHVFNVVHASVFMNDDIQFKTDLFTFNQTRKDFTTFEALASYLKRPDDFIKIKAFTRLTVNVVLNQYLKKRTQHILMTHFKQWRQCIENKGGVDDSIVQDHADKLGPQPGVSDSHSSNIQDSELDPSAGLRALLVQQGIGLSYIFDEEGVTLSDVFDAQHERFVPEGAVRVGFNFMALGISIKNRGDEVFFSNDVSKSDIDGLAQLSMTCVGFTRINDNLLKEFMRNELKKKSKGNSVVDTIHFKEQPSPYQLKILSTSSDIKSLYLNDVSTIEVMQSIGRNIGYLGLSGDVSLDVIKQLKFKQGIIGIEFNSLCTIAHIKALKGSGVKAVGIANGINPGYRLERELKRMNIMLLSSR